MVIPTGIEPVNLYSLQGESASPVELQDKNIIKVSSTDIQWLSQRLSSGAASYQKPRSQMYIAFNIMLYLLVSKGRYFRCSLFYLSIASGLASRHELVESSEILLNWTIIAVCLMNTLAPEEILNSLYYSTYHGVFLLFLLNLEANPVESIWQSTFYLYYKVIVSLTIQRENVCVKLNLLFVVLYLFR